MTDDSHHLLVDWIVWLALLSCPVRLLKLLPRRLDASFPCLFFVLCFVVVAVVGVTNGQQTEIKKTQPNQTTETTTKHHSINNNARWTNIINKALFFCCFNYFFLFYVYCFFIVDCAWIAYLCTYLSAYYQIHFLWGFFSLGLIYYRFIFHQRFPNVDS